MQKKAKRRSMKLQSVRRSFIDLQKGSLSWWAEGEGGREGLERKRKRTSRSIREAKEASTIISRVI